MRLLHIIEDEIERSGFNNWQLSTYWKSNLTRVKEHKISIPIYVCFLWICQLFSA